GGVDAASRCLPGLRAVLLAPDLARSTARKKGRRRSSAWRRRRPHRIGRHKNSLAGLWTITCSARRHPPAGGISLKAHKKKRFRARGEGAPGPPERRNTRAQAYGKELRRALRPAAP